MIPKTIHQTHRDENLDFVIGSQKSIKDTNPDWDYKFWSDSIGKELVFDVFPEFSKTWDLIPNKNIIKWNLLRFMIIYSEGGLYVDSDTVFKKNIDKIIDLEYDFVGIKKHKINNWVKDHFFAANKHSEFLYSCIKKIINNIKSNKTLNISVHDICGGHFLDRELTIYSKNNNLKYKLLKPEFVSNLNLEHEGYIDNKEENKRFNWDNVYVVHLLDGSWLK